MKTSQRLPLAPRRSGWPSEWSPSGATYHAEGGDSGGPVLGYGGVPGNVVLFGIHNGDGGVFSSIGYIVNELGPLDF